VLRPAFDYSVIEAAANYRSGRAAVVIETSLEGEHATAMVEAREEASEPWAPDAPEPEADAPVAAAASTARLLQLFPDKFAERMRAAEPLDRSQPPPPPFALQGEEGDASPPRPAMNDSAPPPPEARPEPPPAAPSRPVPEPARFAVGFGGFAPPPVRQFETPPPFSTPEAALDVPAAPEPPPTSLFDAPSVRNPLPAADGFHPHPVEIDPFAVPAEPFHEPHGLDIGTLSPPPQRLKNRALIYLAVGILGAALFAAAVFSMMSGKASPSNLVIGLMGILLMVPAGGYFLLHFLNQRDGQADSGPL
jgi:hypothetical protein